jgi:uncharacterized membrane protein
MGKTLSLLKGLGLGAGVMYLLDPQSGNRRRALLRDQAVRILHQAGDAVGPATRDLGNRARGLLAESTAMIMNQPVADNVLEQRVRAKLGRFSSHPGAIDVTASQGQVTLHGPILAHELDQLLVAVATIPGVRGVHNWMDVHSEPGDVPGLQGGRSRPGASFELAQQNWAPGPRLLVGAAGAYLTLKGLARRGLLGAVLGTAGAGLLTRSLANSPMRRVGGLGSGRRAVQLQKTINVNAPVGEVFGFWSNFENFPRFMSHLMDVRDLGGGRSHWKALGPAGVPVSWNAAITKVIDGEVIAWRSEPGSVVGNSGIVHFTPNADGGTQVDVRMSYSPPAGVIGHAVAAFFGSDPKTAMDEDLLRFKSLMEQGRTTADGEEVGLQESAGESMQRQPQWGD